MGHYTRAIKDRAERAEKRLPPHWNESQRKPTERRAAIALLTASALSVGTIVIFIAAILIAANGG